MQGKTLCGYPVLLASIYCIISSRDISAMAGPYLRSKERFRCMSERVDDILAKMTLREKVALLAGSDLWHTVPIERLGIPALKMTDGPNGARGAGSLTGGVKTACFPAGISLASTWNTDLVERVGQALADETKLKGAQVLL